MLVLKQGQSEARVLKQHIPIRLSVSEAVSGSVTNPPITRHKGMIDFLPLSIFLDRERAICKDQSNWNCSKYVNRRIYF